MTVNFYKHQDHERSTGIQVFDVEMQPTPTPDESSRDLRSYVEEARREQQSIAEHAAAKTVVHSPTPR